MWIDEIGNHRWKKYSQYGEEGFLDFIFKNVGVSNSFLVDIGANDGTYLSNTKYFRKRGWNALLIDGQKFRDVNQYYVSADNINSILLQHEVPSKFDLLSIDIDGQDYWVLKELLTIFRPRVIISEYNSEFTDSRTIERDAKFYFRATDYYGYTFEAGLKLARDFGYRVIFQNDNLNMYYIRKELLDDPDMEIDVPHPMVTWWRDNVGDYQGKVDTRKKWVMV